MNYLFRSWKTARCDESNLKYFDATFLDHKDVFYAHLNEIDPIHNDEFSEEQIERSASVYVDPRNGLPVRKAVVTEDELYQLPSLFKFFSTKSTLNAAEHAICLKALLESRKIAGLEDSVEKNYYTTEVLEKYNSLKEKISNENKQYQDFVKNYFVSNNMYRKKEINLRLFSLFVDKWKREVDLFMENETDLISHNYVLATAIPLKCDKSQIKDVTLKVSDENSSKRIAKSVFPNDTIKYRMNGVHFHLEKYYNECRNDQRTKIEHPPTSADNVDVFIPITSLLCIIQGYNDECDDWMIPITITDENKIFMDKNLPKTKIGSISRNNDIAMDVIKAIFVQRSDKNDEASSNVQQSETSSSKVSCYQIKAFDQFMEEYTRKNKSDVNEDLEVGNSVEISTNDGSLSLMVSCLVPDATEKENLVIFSPKLEYQPEFGEEQMSQCELIWEWVHLKFIHNTLIKRIRMHYSTYAILSVRNITLNMVKEELHRLYQIQEEELLSSLLQLISMLRGFPPAIYLGRYDPAKKERILIYQHHDQKPMENASTSTHLNLQNIYSTINFNANSLDELQWTPIDLEGVTDIHLKSKVAPGLFPFYGNHFSKQIRDHQRNPKYIPISKKVNVTINKNKKKKRKAKGNKKQLLKKLSTMSDESCDPKQLFDESGNVNIVSLLHSNPSSKRIPCVEQSQENAVESQEAIKILPINKETDPDEALPSKKRIVLRNREIAVHHTKK